MVNMKKFNVACGRLRATVLAPTEQDAALASLEFLDKAKGNTVLAHDFCVWPAGQNITDENSVLIPFEEILIEAGWELD